MGTMLNISKYLGDHDSLSLNIGKSWRTDAYCPDLIQYIIGHPHTIDELCLQATVSGEIVSFLYSRSRKITYSGHQYDVVHNTLAATNPEFSHLIPYIQIRNVFNRKCAELEFTHYSGFTEHGIDNAQIAVEFARLHSHSHQIIGSVCVHNCPDSMCIDDAPGIHFNPVPQLEDLERVAKLADTFHADNFYKLYEHVSASDLTYKIRNARYGGIYLIESSGCEGFIVYQKRSAGSGDKRVCKAYVSSMFLELFGAGERISILGKFGSLLKSQGVDSIQLVSCSEQEYEFMLECGFPVSETKLRSDLNLSTLSGENPDLGDWDAGFYYDYF